MNWVEYVKKTPLVQMYTDWCEYNMLRKQRNMYKSGMMYWKTRIANTVTYQGDFCKRTDYKIVGLFKKKSRTHYCKEFFEQKCHKICPLHEEHNSYWHFYNQYKKKSQAVADFWRNKFQNVK